VLKIKHPGSITRDREKKVNTWETVRTYKYSNGVECQILIGFLPHGHAQSAISANRTFKLEKDGDDLALVFSEEAAPIVDFLNGDRLTAESSNAVVLDPCGFVPTVQVGVVSNGQAGELKEEGGNLVAAFGDGTTITLHPHGGHAHVEAKQGDKSVKTFFNGKENKLYAFGVLER
jgi:hypothetical protein